MLRHRVVTALWFAPLFLVALYQGTWVFGAFLALAAVLSALEMARLLRANEYRPSVVVIGGLPLLLLAGVYTGAGRTAEAVALVLLGSLVLYTFRDVPPSVALPSWGLSLAAALYLAWPLQHFALLRQAQDGLLWAGWALVGTWACDTSAYFLGRAFGRRRLYPRLSPGKTWEGTVGGALVTGVLSAALAPQFLPVSAVSAAVLGLLIGVAAVLGDLAESFLKRAAGVKDSGGLLPGHGGVLDRLDSLLFVVLVVYYFRLWIVGVG